MFAAAGIRIRPRNVILARVTRAFEAIDRDRIDAHAFGRLCVAHGRAFVNDLDAMSLEMVDVLLRLVARRLHDLDAAIDNGLPVFGVRRRRDRRKDGEVHAEGAIGQASRAGDLL